ncbi:MAG: hypothetical protein JXB60_02660 [Candidatus Cloacimonetes bacterium]|nr:hypothetical protein [Candidatus Cloacimonadota bacterium]
MYLKKLFTFAVVILAAIVITGCLTTETKEYRFKINQDGSGEGKIKFINIVSEEDEEQDVSFNDFGELISDYMEGHTFETDNPHYEVLDKRLYEENGVLVGEVSFKFVHADSVGFLRNTDCDCAPLLYYLGSLSETLLETNGEYLGLGRDFPIIQWPAGTEELFFKTSVKEDMSDAHGLLPLYQTWLENKEE